MENFLAQLMGTAQPAQTAIPQAVAGSPAQERAARKAGFPSHDAMMQWARQRNTPTGGTIPQGQQPGPAGSVAAGMNGVSMMHPANILNYILQKWQGATGGN